MGLDVDERRHHRRGEGAAEGASATTCASPTCACPTARASSWCATSPAHARRRAGGGDHRLRQRRERGGRAQGRRLRLRRPSRSASSSCARWCKSALTLPERARAPRRATQQLLGESAPLRAGARADRQARAQPGAGLHLGESGSGKELAARLIHENGARREQPFVPVNCGAIPENLMESEFFGYKKGAFTGADEDRDGFFQAANGGTLFLDEVADLPLRDAGEAAARDPGEGVRKVGATQEDPVDVRIICATHQNLAALVDGGRFRQDLYYRLNVIELAMPPLRECREDIPLHRRRASCERLARAERRAGAAPGRRGARRRSQRYDFPATCASSRTSSSARSRSPAAQRDQRRGPAARPRRRRASASRPSAAAGEWPLQRLPRPRRAQGDPRGARQDRLQPHRRGEAARHHVPRSCATGCSASRITEEDR